MKKLHISFVLTFTICLSFAQKGIVVTQQHRSASTDAGVTLTWYITEKSAKMVMQFRDAKVQNTVTHFIPNTQSAALQIYTEGPVPEGAQKTFFTVPVSTIKPSPAMQFSRIEVNATGEVKEIMGIKCEKYIITTDLHITEMWVTKQIKYNLYHYYPYFPDNLPLMGLYHAKIPGVVLSAITKDLTEKELSRLELVKAEEKNIPDEVFLVPDEYKSAK
ncbi:MAG: DUF4412 domain-containing protein [Chitinophagales bacterium]|nr:DUF4412 domain-containing protein [Chitinophagales bacterium]MDW8419755.1 DUF4412 domain-containing protein [Chitinophagales bacterium]